MIAAMTDGMELPPERPLPAQTPPFPWRISLIAGSLLILELAFIRMIPAQVRIISYFTNLILMAAFFGLGVGCIFQKRRSLGWTLPLGLFLVFSYIYLFRGIEVFAEARSVHYWLDQNVVAGTAPAVPLFTAACLIFVIAALPFIGMGQALAREMEHHLRLKAYA